MDTDNVAADGDDKLSNVICFFLLEGWTVDTN